MKRILFFLIFFVFFIPSNETYSQRTKVQKRAFKKESVFRDNSTFKNNPVLYKEKGNKFFPPPPDPNDGGDGDPVASPIDGINYFIVLGLFFILFRKMRSTNREFF